jgi:acetyl-CoA carboxylase carboxyltransferase component
MSFAEARVDAQRPVDGNGWPLRPDDTGIEAVAEALRCDRRLVSAWWSEFVRQRLTSPAAHPTLEVEDPAPADRAQVQRSRLTPAGEAAPLRERTAWLAGQKNAARDGDSGATERQHAKGKLTARQRLELLLDAGSFVELDLLARHTASGFGLEDRRPATDGVVAGWGTVSGRQVFVFAQDFGIFGGALGHTGAGKIHKVMDMAESVGAPIVALNDGAGARIQEGVSALAGYGGIFRRNVRASGVIPQISVILGPCAGGAAYSPALTDFVFMVDGTSNMFITGPDVLAAATGERVGPDELGGAAAHAQRSGVASFVADTEHDCLEQVRYLLSFLPSNNDELPPSYPASDDPERRCDRLLDVVPADSRTSYDVRDVLRETVDDGELLEVRRDWARNVVCAFARVDGHVVGLVANQPMVLAGCLDINASEKAAGFVRTCDAFNVPLITFVDVPGFLPGSSQEHGGIIRHGAKLLYAYCDATVPRIQVILRKAFGGAYIVMDSKSIGADLSFAWPGNEIAVMGPEAAAGVVFRRELERSADPDARRRELCAEYAARLMSPLEAAERGFVDDVIDPADTRRMLVRSLAMLRSKREQLPRRKHGHEPF